MMYIIEKTYAEHAHDLPYLREQYGVDDWRYFVAKAVAVGNGRLQRVWVIQDDLDEEPAFFADEQDMLKSWDAAPPWMIAQLRMEGKIP